MIIKYNPIIPINYLFFKCIFLIGILSILIEVYLLSEINLMVILFVLFVFWITWFSYDMIQNKKMDIKNMLIEEHYFIVITSNKKYMFRFDEVFIEKTWFGCIKNLKVSNKFYLSSAYINGKDFIGLEQKLQKKNINIINLNIKYKILSFVIVSSLIMILSKILNIRFDNILYSIIGIYLAYQIFKKKN